MPGLSGRGLLLWNEVDGGRLERGEDLSPRFERQTRLRLLGHGGDQVEAVVHGEKLILVLFKTGRVRANDDALDMAHSERPRLPNISEN